MEIKSISIIVAMQQEANPIISALGLVYSGKISEQLPMLNYEGITNGVNVNLVTNGICPTYGIDLVASQPSILSTYVCVEKRKPSLIINAGTAGGFKKYGANIGDVYLGSPHVCFHDRRINLPGFSEYGMGFYTTYPCEVMAKKMALKTGVVSTGNSLDFSDDDKRVMDTYKGSVKDMEAAAVGWVANLLQIPFIAVKAITDIVDGSNPTKDEFLNNLELASENLAAQLAKIVCFLSTNDLH
ncbi:MAG TPA: hypothetical protein PL017_05140 [Tenuifilaceae bacterium]|nr:hypothetical protein [Tenuifilaceae bacterium]HPJ45461.1 hypothetical protein [Tenuifilaceae bacterium]